MSNKKKIATVTFTLFIAFVFIQSLFFKFAGAPETVYIFETIDKWVTASFGISGLFVPPGIFNAYVIGSAELVASALLLVGLFTKRYALHGLGAVLALSVISGAIFFHLFTPLGINVQGDDGTLFGMACGVWFSAASLIYIRKEALLGLINRKVS